MAYVCNLWQNGFYLHVSMFVMQSSSQNKKVLLEAAQKLERDVLVPLNELAQTTLFSYEMLQETYRSQVELIEGSDNNDRAAGAASDAPTLSSGIKKIVAGLNTEHDALAERVRKIQEKFAAQRETAERHLAFAISQRAKVTFSAGCIQYVCRSYPSHVFWLCRCLRLKVCTSVSWRTGPRL